MKTEDLRDPVQYMTTLLKKTTAIVKVLKKRFNNLTAEEAIQLAGEIVIAVQEVEDEE